MFDKTEPNLHNDPHVINKNQFINDQFCIMKILVIGGHGTIGKKVVAELNLKHEVIIGGRTTGDVEVDIEDSTVIKNVLDQLQPLDAIVSIAGEARWADFDDLSEQDYYIGIRSKLMGQVNLVRHGVKALHPGGSITLSTGILADDPVPRTSSAAMVNGALHSFVQATQLELDFIRLNVVSLGLVEDAYEKYKDYFPGHVPITMNQAAQAYVRAIEGKGRGEIIRVY